MSLPLNKWYKINPDREDLEKFLMTLESRYYAFGDFEFRNNKTEFSRIKETEHYVAENYTGEITFKIEYDDHLVQLPYDHLPEPKYTEESKKVKRRAT